MPLKKHPWYLKTILVLLHSLLLVVFTWLWINQHRVLAGEKILIQWSTVLKRYVFKLNGDRPPIGELLLLDVSGNKMLYESAHSPSPGLTTPITDRFALRKLFTLLNQHPQYKLFVCDIRFSPYYTPGKSDYYQLNERLITQNDIQLKKEVFKLSKALFPRHLESDQTLDTTLFPGLNFGLADYIALGKRFYKYRLKEQDSLVSLPLKMYQMLHPTAYQRTQQKLTLPQIIVDFKMLPDQVSGHTPYFVTRPLSDFLTEYADSVQADADTPTKKVLQSGATQRFVKKYLQNRIILLGDFKRDQHHTIVGHLPGTVLLANVYYALRDGAHFIPRGLVVVLILCYLIISYQLIYGFGFWKHAPDPDAPDNRSTFAKKYLSWVAYPILLIIFSVAIYLFYQVHIEVMIIGAYATLIENRKMVLRYFKKIFRFF